MFLYNNNELSETEIKKTVPFTISSRRIQYLEINLSTEAKELYSENYKTDERNWRWHNEMDIFPLISISWISIHAHGLEDINIVKMIILPRVIYRFKNTNTHDISFTDTEQIILKFVWKHERP